MHLRHYLTTLATTIVAAVAGADTTTLNTLHPASGGEYGGSVALVDDIDGDDYPDVLVGAPDEDTTVVEGGRVYVYSGKTGALIREHVSFVPQSFGRFGERVLGLPDINGDNRADYAIAAPHQRAGHEGDLYVCSGSNGALLYHLNGWFYHTFGTISLVPDCSGDGMPELVCGYAGPGNYAEVRVFHAKNGVLWKTLTSPIAAGNASSFGTAVAGVADVTGDGKGDVIVGAPDAWPGESPIAAGRVYLYNGATGALVQAIVSHDQQTSGRFGSSVAGINDINGDGRGDLIIGAENEMPDGSALHAGQVHVHSGASGAWIRTLASSDPEAGGDFGYVVASCGDINEDGKPDIIVGAPQEDVSATEQGRVYKFSGADGALISQLNAPGTNAMRFGDSLDASQDINKDGKPDLIVGAPATDSGGFNAAGAAYMYRIIDNDGCTVFGSTSVTNGTWPFTTVGASTSGSPEQECFQAAFNDINNDVFFNYTATCNGSVTVSTCNSADFDTRIGVYLGCAYVGAPIGVCDLDTILGCNDDTRGCDYGSVVTVPVTAGQCYRIRIGGFVAISEGSGTFSIVCESSCLGDVSGDNQVDAADIAILLGAWGQPGAADFNGSGVVDSADLATMLGAWGDC